MNFFTTTQIKDVCDSDSPGPQIIFNKCGSIFVSNEVTPPQRELLDIIKLAGGEVRHQSASFEPLDSFSPIPLKLQLPMTIYRNVVFLVRICVFH